MNLGQKFVTAVKWSASSQLASRVIQPLAYLLLARILAPEDFGVFAIAILFVNFAQALIDSGLTQALIQRAGIVTEAAFVTFWVKLGFSILFYILISSLAGFIALKFEYPETENVLLVLGLQLLLAPSITVRSALFQRELNFRPLFVSGLVSTATYGLIALTLAWRGYGFWALVLGNLAGEFAKMFVLCLGSQWRPQWRFDLKTARQMFRFSAWSSAESLIGWFYNWGDTLIVAAFLTTAAVGLYRTGTNLVIVLFTIILSPIQPVLFSTLSRLKDNRARFEEFHLAAGKALTMIAFPAAAFIFVFSESIDQILFTEEWEGISDILAWAALAQGLAWSVGANTSAYSAIGRPDISVKLNSMMLLLYIPVYVLAAEHGLKTLLVARVILVSMAVAIHVVIVSKVFERPLDHFLKQVLWSGLACLAAAGVVLAIRYLGTDGKDLLTNMALATVGLAIYSVVITKEWPFVRRLLTQIRSNSIEG